MRISEWGGTHSGTTGTDISTWTGEFINPLVLLPLKGARVHGLYSSSDTNPSWHVQEWSWIKATVTSTVNRQQRQNMHSDKEKEKHSFSPPNEATGSKHCGQRRWTPGPTRDLYWSCRSVEKGLWYVSYLFIMKYTQTQDDNAELSIPRLWLFYHKWCYIHAIKRHWNSQVRQLHRMKVSRWQSPNKSC